MQVNNSDDPICCICHREGVYVDPFHHKWCEEHKYRYDFLIWGCNHGYMDLNCETFAVAQGAYHWFTLAVIGREEALYTFLAYIEWLEDEWAKMEGKTA